jgi:anti-sigma B factor antagonist
MARSDSFRLDTLRERAFDEHPLRSYDSRAGRVATPRGRRADSRAIEDEIHGGVGSDFARDRQHWTAMTSRPSGKRFTPNPYAIDVELIGPVALIAIAGEFDIGCESELDHELEELLARKVEQVVLDLREVVFIDSHGVRLMLKYEIRSRKDGFEFAVIPARGQVRRVFETMGIDRLIRLMDDLSSLDQDASDGHEPSDI